MRFCPTLAILALSLGVAACDDKPDAATAASASASAAAPPAPEPTPTVEARNNPDDLDLSGLQNELGCAGGKGGKSASVCRVVEDFSKGEKWDGKTPSGKGVWVGWAYRLEQGQETRERMLLVARTVPTAKVGPNDLPILVATGEIPDKLQRDWDKMIRQLGYGSRVKSKNLCLRFIETFQPELERGAIFTNGASTQLIADEEVFVRKEGIKKLHFIERGAKRNAAAGDGRYATLDLAVW